jgi:hypothetical protein
MPAQPSGEFWLDSPCHGHGAGVVTTRLGRARRHGGEVANGEPATQMPCGLHQREEGRAGVVSGKFMMVLAYRDDGAAWGSRVDSAWRRLIGDDR